MKPPAKRETQPHLRHLPEPARTPENNVENIQEEIRPYLSSALQLFGQLPSGPITTGHPGTQSYQAKSSRVVVSQGTTPQYHVFQLTIRLLLRLRQLRERKTRPEKSASPLPQLSVQNVQGKTVFTTEKSSPHFQPNILKSFQVM